MQESHNLMTDITCFVNLIKNACKNFMKYVQQIGWREFLENFFKLSFEKKEKKKKEKLYTERNWKKEKYFKASNTVLLPVKERKMTKQIHAQ